MSNTYTTLLELARKSWMRLREWCGDSAYERYERVAVRQKGGCALTREQFYVEQLERRYSRPNRCC